MLTSSLPSLLPNLVHIHGLAIRPRAQAIIPLASFPEAESQITRELRWQQRELRRLTDRIRISMAPALDMMRNEALAAARERYVPLYSVDTAIGYSALFDPSYLLRCGFSRQASSGSLIYYCNL